MSKAGRWRRETVQETRHRTRVVHEVAVHQLRVLYFVSIPMWKLFFSMVLIDMQGFLALWFGPTDQMALLLHSRIHVPVSLITT